MRSHYNRRDWEREKRDLDQKWNHQPGYKGLNIGAGLVFAGIIAVGLLCALVKEVPHVGIILGAIGVLVLVIFLVIIASLPPGPPDPPRPKRVTRTPDLRESDEYTGK